MSALLRLAVPAVVINAAVQAALVAPSVAPSWGWVFVALTVVSLAAATVALAVVASAIGGRGWPRLLVLAWSAVVMLIVFAAAVLSPVLAPVGALVGAITLPAAVATGRPLAGFAVFARRPVHAVLLTLGMLALTLVAWLVALLLGFFVTGVLGAVATWLLFGIVAISALHVFTRLSRAAPTRLSVSDALQERRAD